jgi:hypothetical protein
MRETQIGGHQVEIGAERDDDVPQRERPVQHVGDVAFDAHRADAE